MTIRELVYIKTVAEMGNISKAAEKLFIAQPSLSRCIQKIERDLGVELFKRTQEGLKLTTAGEYYMESANSILRICKDLDTKFSYLNDMKVGKLTIGTTTYLGSFALPKILSAFSALYPDIEISIVEGVSLDIENEIIKGSVDLAILHTPLVTNAIDYKVITKERFLLAVPPDDPINKKSYVKDQSGYRYMDIGLTSNKKYILTHPEQRTRQVANAVLSKANIKPKIKYITKSIHTATRLVSENLGFTLVPHSYCSVFSQDYLPKYYFIEDEFDPYWELVVCYSKDIPLSKAAVELIRICNEIIPGLYK
ncbi:LysR family transcriptional regulator [Lutispora sp.]|uniref:LysR family transcriptional regulator n=1 Tax=Lutispora sp. TaxID=2828727 RepID=UPI000ECA7169|nr:LysR family transcriptional regulator [Lutispora sp.]MEA4960738.1 LysR family transcriptional regulator [Lutispora sp.]HCJ57650.1 LysR family transcriptional regulator [Clostridiaceae bacterium]